jgi:hypothetical protein
MRIRTRARVVVGVSVLVAELCVYSGASEAQSFFDGAHWSVPGSVGTVDESSAGQVLLDQVKASVRPSAAGGTVVYLRYPISIVPYWLYHVEDEYAAGPWDFAGYYKRLIFKMSFQKNEDAALIVAGLRRVRLSDGENVLFAALDNGSALSGAAVQQVTKTVTCEEGCFQPDHAYFVEVGLWKARATADPKLVSLGVTLMP